MIPVADDFLQQWQAALAMAANTTESKLTRLITEFQVSVVILMWNHEYILVRDVSTTSLENIPAILVNQVNADWRTCAKGEVDPDSLVGAAHLDLEEFLPMLNPPRAIQQWAKMDVSSERMMKYQLHPRRSQEAAQTAQLLG